MFRVMIGAFALLTISACGDHGSLIPFPPGTGGAGGDGGTHCGLVCDDFGRKEVVKHCAAFCGDVVCSIEGVEACAPSCEDCTPFYNEGYGDGFAAASDLCDLDGSYLDGYNAGFEDGVDSVVCEIDDDEEPDCTEDVPIGHLHKDCRGKPVSD